MKTIFTTLFSFLFIAYIHAQVTQLWSISSNGGANDNGAIFRINSDGSNYSRPFDFPVTNPGYNPQRVTLCQASNGLLYGTTQIGGVNSLGVLFSFNTSNNTYTVVWNFSGTADGANPHGSLIQAGNGLLYGMAFQGGANNDGTLFSFNTSTNTLTKIIDFNGTANGAYPYGDLLQADNGLLYCMTSYGGVNNRGTLFSFNNSTNILTKIIDFNGTGNGQYPQTSLMQADNGLLYGAAGGGANNAGVLFSLNTSTNTYTDVWNFSGSSGGGYPDGGCLMQAGNGLLYGMASGGGANTDGVIFSFNTSTNTYTDVWDFSGAADGASPIGSLMQAGNGLLYGMTQNGGANDNGVMFSFNTSTNILTKIIDFSDTVSGANPYGSLMQATNGLLYGVASQGGQTTEQTGLGTLFSFNTSTSIFTKIIDFSIYPDGSGLYGIMLANNGLLYGATDGGGVDDEDAGVLYSFNPSDNTITNIINFDGTNNGGIRNFNSSLMQATNGLLYGLSEGGAFDDGTLFSFNTSNNTITKLIDFNGTANGAIPYGALVQAVNGLLYGMTYIGGADGYGTLFSFNTSTNVLTKSIDFGGTANGENPEGSLIQATNGLLYGLTRYGGANNDGEIFSFNTSTNTYTDVWDFSGTADGRNPINTLMQASNGLLYGTAINGGANNEGTLFSFNTSSNTLTKIIDFNVTANGYPTGNLMQASNGLLYGMTAYGGTNSHGTLFSFNTITNALTTLRELALPDGINPASSTFIEFPFTITTGTLSSTTYCAGSSISVPFTVSATFDAGNTFTAQLSNASGSFASPVNIGSVTSISEGTISATIPGGTATGSGYLIQVVSSNPAVTGTNNGSNITINPSGPNPTVSIGGVVSAICQGGTTAVLDGSFGGSATAAVWSDGASGTFANNGGSTPGTATYTASVNSTTPITLTLTTSGGSCGTASASEEVTVNPLLTPAVSISANTGNIICAGTGVTFTASPTNGGATPSYQWQLNSGSGFANINGATNSTYTDNSVANGNEYEVSMTSSISCPFVNPVTSNVEVMTVVSGSTPATWIGGHSNDWNDPLNWCDGVPDSTTNVVIPDSTTTIYTPLISSETAQGANLTINDNGILRIAVGGVFSLYGNLSIALYGAYVQEDITSDTLKLEGSNAQTIDTATVNNLVVNDSAGITMKGDLTVTGSIMLLSGVINTTYNGTTFKVDVQDTSVTAVSGESPSSYINGILRRAVNKTTGTGAYNFPVGTSSNYELATINFNSNSDIDSLTAVFNTYNAICSSDWPNPDGSYPYVNSTAVTNFLNGGYWTITPNTTDYTGINYDATLNETGYSTSGVPDAGDFFDLIKREDCASDWKSGIHVVNTTPVANSTVTTMATGFNSFSDYGIGYGGSVLPIQLVSFNGWNKGAVNDLQWITASEYNTDYYSVERSADAEHFEQIGTVQAAGISLTPTTYNYSDNAPLMGLNYYRLQVFYTGDTSDYSNIIALKSLGTSDVVSVYPNPFESSTSISIKGTEDDLVSYRIVDVLGRIMNEQTLALSPGENIYQINTANLSAGCYFIEVFDQSGNRISVNKLFKDQ